MSNTQKSPKENLQAINNSPSYRLAFKDTDFLQWDELRPMRLQLELLKPELVMNTNDIQSTIVIFGSARLQSKEAADAHYTETRSKLKQNPNDDNLQLMMKRAEKTKEFSHYYEEARKLGELISASQLSTEKKYMVVTGGGPGIMEAANRGAFESGQSSIGLNITLEHEQEPNPYIDPELCFQFQYFAIRKMHFLLRAKAMIAFPGGFGTFDEVFETLTLIQTERMERIPVYLFGESFWSKVVNFDYLVETGVISATDLDLFTYVDTAEETWQLIQNYYNM